MTQVNIHEAKTHLSRLIAAIKSGKETEIIVAQNGVPAARIVPIEAGPPFRCKPIRFGIGEGLFAVPEGIDRENEEIARLFYGEED